MKYTVKLYSNNDVISETSFVTKDEARSYIAKVITDASFPMRISIERKYIIRDNVKILNEIVYYVY